MLQKRSMAVATSLFVALAAAPALAVAPPLTGDPYQATVTKVVRRVEWQRANTAVWQPAFVHNLLVVGDTLRTGTDAKAELEYGDGSISRVGSLTSFTLTGEGGKRELHLNAGKVWLHIQKSGYGMKVITPGAVAAVTGTELMVEFDPARRLTEVTVFEGAVNVTGDVGNLVRVLGGTTTQVPARAPAITPVPLDKHKLEERENIFRPLAVSGDSSKPAEGNPSTAETPEPQTGETPHTSATPGTGVSPVTKPTAGTADAKAPVTTPIGKEPPGDTDQKPVSPDLKAQTQQTLDPRLLNGSPTSGRIKVIIQ